MCKMAMLVLLASILAICISGCNKQSDSAFIPMKDMQGPHVFGISDRNRMRAPALESQHSVPNMLPQNGIKKVRKIGLTVNHAGVSDEIAGRICGTRSGWEAYHTGMTSARRRNPVGKPRSQPVVVKDADSFHAVSAEEMAIQRKYSDSTLNCRLRIQLLESRYESSSGSVRDKLNKQLGQLRADLKSIDDACQSELDSLKK